MPINPYQFILYDTGLLIFERTSASRIDEYFYVQLSSDEVQKLLGELPLDEFFRLDSDYDLVNGSDFPTYIIEARDPKTKEVHLTFVRGILSAGQRSPGDMNDAAPTAFVRIYDRLHTYSHPRERPWFPDYVSVHVSKARPGPSCIWPSAWGDLDSAGSVRLSPREGDGALGTIRAKGDLLVEIQRFLNDCHERNGELTVMLNGQPVWMNVGSFNLPSQVQ